jgi:outer membrane protein assembly factor BamB
VLSLALCAAGGAGCGQRVVGHLPIDGGSDAVPPGAIVWTFPGVPISDGSANVYVLTNGPGAAGFALLDRARGVPAWRYEGPLRFRCFGPGTIVLSDLPDGVPPPGKYGAALLSSSDGSPKRMLALTNPTELSCWPLWDRLTVVENVSGGPNITAYIASAAEQLWSRVPITPPVPQHFAIANVDKTQVYSSWYLLNNPPPGATSALLFQRSSDGESTGGVSFAVSTKMDFLFDLGGTIYAVDNSVNRWSVTALDRSGVKMWSQTSSSNDTRIVVDPMQQLVLVLMGETLLILNGPTGQQPGDTYNANPDGRYESWDVLPTPGGDLHVVGRRGTMVTHTMVNVLGHVLFVWSAAGRPNAALFVARDGGLYRAGDGAIAQVDRSGRPYWTFDDETIDRVIGADGDLVFAAGPPTGCPPCVEHVIALDATDGHLVWKTSEAVPAPSAFFAADSERVYLSVAPADLPPIGRIIALRR